MKRFIELISDEKNFLVQDIKNIINTNTYIYGGGGGQIVIEKLLKDLNVPFKARLISRQYFHNQDGYFCLDDVLETCKDKVNIIVAFTGFKYEFLDRYREKIDKIIFRDCSMYHITKEYVKEHEDGFQWMFDKLEDEYSKNLFVHFVNQKVTAEHSLLEKFVETNQYFPEDIFDFSNREVFLDCGAYDGDSIRAFIEHLNSHGIKEYCNIVGFEPDEKNYKKLVGRNIDKFIGIQAGVGKEKDILKFCSNGTVGAKIDSNGDSEINIVAIDDIVKQYDLQPTYIKMDIEGAELDALMGAKETIVKFLPKLAICAYHKPEHLWELGQYIDNLGCGYKFYFRQYSDMANELVLYAVVR